MTDINSVNLIGRVTHDIGEKDFGYVGENAKLNISVAVNKSRKVNDEWVNDAYYFDVEVWGKQAEALKNLISKGKQVGVLGSLRQSRWEKDGQKHSKVFIYAETVQLLGGRDSAEAEPGNTFKPANAAPTKDDFVPPNMKAYMNKPQEQTLEGFQEDIPF